MRCFALLLSLLCLSSCASSDGFEPAQTFGCEPGQPITIVAGFESFRAGMEGVDDQQTLAVVVANNSHQEIVVKFVRVDQMPDSRAVYRLDNGYREFNEIVAEGKEIELKVPMAGRPAGRGEESMSRRRSILLGVSVGLGNGDRYRCEFEIPIR